MNRVSALSDLLLATLAGLLAAGAAQAEPAARANTHLDFRIQVPAVARLEANQHPLQVVADDRDPGTRRAEQHVVVFSNLRRGLCMQLRLALPQVSGWRVQLSDPASASLTAQGGDHYRLCTQRIGRTAIALVHRFEASDPAQPLPWPVQTDLHAI